MDAASKLVVIGIDAADRHLIINWAREGSLPTFGRLFDTAAWGDSRNPTGMVAGTVWPTFYMSVMPGRTGRFRGTTQFVAGTYRHGDIDAAAYSRPTFWDVLSDNGRKSCVVDAPYAFLSDRSHVVQLVDWCSHSPWKDGVTLSRPAELANKVRERFGSDPIGKCDFVTLETVEDFRRFRDALIERVRRRTEFTLQQLDAHDVDLFLNVYSECHCAGHQLWHVHDPQHPLHDPVLAAALGGDPVKHVYEAVDGAVGRLLEHIDPATRVIIFCSHGMGPAYTGTHLLDEILLRIEGIASPRKRQSVARALVATWTRLPQALRTRLTPLQKRVWPGLKSSLVQPHKERRRFFEVIVNDATGGVRINVQGREPDGIVEPGTEYDAICHGLKRDLLAVINPTTGKPLVKRVLIARDCYSGEHLDRLPDLLVVWNRAGPIEEACSEQFGRISRRFVFENHRTGDHTEDDGLFFAIGAGIAPGNLGSVSVADLAPTITALLGTPFPNVDGTAIEYLCRRRPASITSDAG